MKFRMVDKILDWHPYLDIRGRKAVSFEEYQLKAAFSDAARLPESLMLESLFQLVSWLAVLSSDYSRLAIVKEFESVRFAGQLRPGRTLEIEARVKKHDERNLIFDAVGTSESKTLVVAENCEAEIVVLDDYCKPDDWRVLYSEIGPVAPDYSRRTG
jgi:3-hydroxymyristoyl/3-hydroxydecanoyl-(acyl carrier protein) dehydratase